MKKIRLLLVVLLVSVYHNFLYAQFQSDTNEEYSVTHYTEENGLTQNSVKNIAPDSEGFIWITTETGLVRFDGKSFYTFDKSNLSIPNNRFSMMQPDLSEKDSGGSKKLYAVAEGYNFIRIKAGKAFADSSYFSKTILRLPFMKKERKLVVLANGSPNYLRDWANPKYYIIPIDQGTGNFYVCHNGRIEYYDHWKKVFDQSFRTPKFWDLFTIGKDLYYFNEHKTLIHVDKNGPSPVSIAGNFTGKQSKNKITQSVEVFWNNISDQVFLYSNRKLYLLTKGVHSGVLSNLVLSNFELDENNISSIYYDQSNQRFFLGSVTKGLFLLKKKNFLTLRTKGGDLENVFYGQTSYDSNAVLTPRGYILKKDKASYKTIVEEVSVIKTSKNSADGYAILTDKRGNVWRKSGTFLYCYNIKENRLIASLNVKAEINHIYEGRDGIIWIGTRESGLFYFKPTDPKSTPKLFLKDSLSRITYILDNNSHALSIGTSHGLFLLDLQSKKLEIVRGTEKLYIRSLYIDSSGSQNKSSKNDIWITTYEDGIFLFKDQKLIKFPLDKNKYLRGSHCIFADNKGFFWITTNRGLFKVSKNDLLYYAENAEKESTSNIFYLHYTKEQGFYTNEFNGGCQPCAIRLPNGYVSVPSLDGLVWFIPEDIKDELPDKKVFLNTYEVGGITKSVLGDTILFPVDPQQIRIHFTSPFFGNLSNLNISYVIQKNSSIKPSEEDWIPVDGNSANISLGSLNAGHYTLYIRKINGFGQNNFTYKKTMMIVPPSWYETLWFRFICLLIFAIALYFFVKFRLKMINKENQLLEVKIAKRTRKLEDTFNALEKSEKELQRQMHIQTRLIASMSHDIKTPLKFVSKSAGKIDLMLRNEKFESVSELGKTIEDTTDHMHHLLENLIIYVKTQVYGSNIKMEEIDLYESLSEKLKIFKGVINDHSNKFVNRIDQNFTVNTNSQLLGIVVHNLVDNANKFTANGTIELFTETWEDRKGLIISDSGTGMPDEIIQWLNNPSKSDSYEKSKLLSKSYSGLGLTIVKEISLMLKIEISVIKRNGTKIQLTFPKEPLS